MLAASFSDGSINCINAIKEKNYLKIIELKSEKISNEIKNYPLDSKEYKHFFSETFNKMFSTINYNQNENISICMDSDWIETKILPVDTKIDNSVKKKYLLWYLNQRNNNLIQESKVFFKNLNFIHGKNSFVLCTIVPKTIFGLLKFCSANNFLRPVFLEPSIISIERVISKNTTIFFSNSQLTKIYLYDKGVIIGEGECKIKSNLIDLIFFSGDIDKAKNIINKINENILDEKFDVFHSNDFPKESLKFFSLRRKIFSKLNPSISKSFIIDLSIKNKKNDLSIFSELFGLISR